MSLHCVALFRSFQCQDYVSIEDTDQKTRDILKYCKEENSLKYWPCGFCWH